MKIELMHLVGDREGLPECSAGYLELRQLKLKHTWQLTACLLQIINGSLPTGSTISIMTVVKGSRVRTVRAMPYKCQKFSSCHDLSYVQKPFLATFVSICQGSFAVFGNLFAMPDFSFQFWQSIKLTKLAKLAC